MFLSAVECAMPFVMQNSDVDPSQTALSSNATYRCHTGYCANSLEEQQSQCILVESCLGNWTSVEECQGIYM